MQPPFDAGLCWFKQQEHAELISQMSRWGPGVRLKNDDLFDSYEMAMSIARKCSRKSVTLEQYEAKRKPQLSGWVL